MHCIVTKYSEFLLGNKWHQWCILIAVLHQTLKLDRCFPNPKQGDCVLVCYHLTRMSKISVFPVSKFKDLIFLFSYSSCRRVLPETSGSFWPCKAQRQRCQECAGFFCPEGCTWQKETLLYVCLFLLPHLTKIHFVHHPPFSCAISPSYLTWKLFY